MFQKQRISLLTQKFTSPMMACAIWVLHLVQILSQKPIYVSSKVEGWIVEIMWLSAIVSTQRHAAYAAFTHGLSSFWTYSSRTIPDIQGLLLPLENAIHQHFIPALAKRHVSSKIERNLLALPVRLGGMGINNPTKESTYAFEASERITALIVALILAQEINQVQMNDPQKVKHLVKR